jgi:hypothetical protein
MNDKNFLRDYDLQKLEERFSQILKQHQPRSTYVKSLRDQLKNSRIFELRRSFGAILVASFGVLLAGALSVSIAVLVQKARRRLRA